MRGEMPFAPNTPGSGSRVLCEYLYQKAQQGFAFRSPNASAKSS
jgi:hypothetical protein